MAEILCRKNIGKLEAVDEAGAELLRSIKQGDVLKVTITRPRNIQFHRLFWALASKVYENQEHYQSVEQVVAALKVATGHCDFIKTRSGMVAIPKSIAFHKMDDLAFRQFFDKCVQFIVAEIIPGTKPGDWQTEILEMVA